LAFRNFKLKKGRMRCESKRRIGHDALVLPVGTSISLVTLKGVHFKWRAGQHLYLWIPSIGPIEAHPYTIACAHKIPGECCCNSIEVVIRRHGGFSKRLYHAAKKEADAGRQLRVAAFVSGPFGNPPRWDTYDTLVLISASTGASFTLPILESIVRSDRKTCVRRVDFILTARKAEETEFYVERLKEALVRGREKGLELYAHLAITGCCEPEEKFEPEEKAEPDEKVEPLNTDSDVNGSSSSLGSPRKRIVPSQDIHQDPERDAEIGLSVVASPIPTSRSGDSGDNNIGLFREYTSRLDISSHIRWPVELAHGETAVAVCGGRPLVAKVRNAVASLSDERAVHKGTGAQGIHLHVEEYSF
jgi:NAD(P)H-flavin reductase